MKKVKNTITTILFGGIIGLIMIVIATILIFSNEKRSVKYEKSIKEARSVLVNVDGTKVDSANEGKLISTSGVLDAGTGPLIDTTFNVSENSTVVLERIVEMYQYEEEESTDSDDNTTYSYTTKWSDEYIDSNSFATSGHDNPTMPYASSKFKATTAKVGAYTLSSEVIDLIDANTNVALTDQTNITIPEGYSISGEYLTNGDVNNPKVGDVRISFKYNTYKTMSFLGAQTGETVTSYISKNGTKIVTVAEGAISGEDLISKVETQQRSQVLIFRILGIALAAIGFAVLASPICAIIELIPFIGKNISGAIGFTGLFIGVGYSLIVTGIAWLAFKPLIGIPCLVGACVLIGGSIYLIKKNLAKKEQSTSGIQTNVVENNDFATTNQNIDTTGITDNSNNQNNI